ncbi:MAG: hypothetical protein ACOY5C_04785, partial [Pseudomonadota bacterium]
MNGTGWGIPSRLSIGVTRAKLFLYPVKLLQTPSHSLPFIPAPSQNYHHSSYCFISHPFNYVSAERLLALQLQDVDAVHHPERARALLLRFQRSNPDLASV